MLTRIIWMLTVGVLFLSMGYAQEVTQQVSELDFLQYAIQTLGGLKGASAWVIAAAIVQVCVKFMNSKFADFAFKKVKGSIKLTIVLFLSYLAGVLSLVTVGDMNIGQALVHSSSLSAFLVLANQIYKQFFVKKD